MPTWQESCHNGQEKEDDDDWLQPSISDWSLSVVNSKLNQHGNFFFLQEYKSVRHEFINVINPTINNRNQTASREKTWLSLENVQDRSKSPITIRLHCLPAVRHDGPFLFPFWRIRTNIRYKLHPPPHHVRGSSPEFSKIWNVLQWPKKEVRFAVSLAWWLIKFVRQKLIPSWCTSGQRSALQNKG